MKPNDLGRTYLVEECPKIRINDLLREYRSRIKETILKSELEALGLKIELTSSKTNYNGIRFWFKCPSCQKKVGVLFRHLLDNRLGCRQCLNLEYRKRRFKGMLEVSLN